MTKNAFSGRSRIKQMPSQAELKALFDYRDGHLYWKVRRNGISDSGRAGSINKKGYVLIQIDGVSWLAHRLCYQWYHGDLEQADIIDHWDGVKMNNKISNLRPCDNKSNVRRKKVMANNTSGLPGVCWHKVKNKWISYYHEDISGKKVNLGYYTNKYEAYHIAREAMLKEYGVDYKEPKLSIDKRHAYMDWLLDENERNDLYSRDIFKMAA